ncbi:MAG: FAD-binding oxidoreductase [Candidatus Yanofskybacteria bacterium]|nr:FAD-binding oxidoreductase [Candidatus Yanofskybacteria bacterium]
MSDIVNEIKNLIEGKVSVSEADLNLFSHDASIFEVKPQLIVRPQNVDDIKKLVSLVSEKKASWPNLSLTARAAGSDMTGGPLNESIILDFTAHFDKINEMGGDYAIVEPGVFYRDFEKETLKKGLLLPSYPASREICTVGGMVANNAGGEKSLRYGKTEDYVEELNVVLSDSNEYVLKPLTSIEFEQKRIQNDFEGNMYRKIHELLITNYELLRKAKPDVSKNSAGYALWNIMKEERFDLTKLFVGSQGTLGIITKIKFRLIRPAKYSQLFVLFLKDMTKIGDLVIDLNKYKPESMESYDDNTIKLTFKILPDLIKKMGLGVLLRFIPDLWVIITGGTPRLVILAEFTGDDEKTLTDKIKSCQKDIVDKFKVKTRIAKSEADVQKYWTIRRESFNLLRKHVKGKKTAPFIDDIIVRPEHLPKFLPELNEILDEHKDYIIYTIAGHPGDGNFHIIPLMNLSDERSRNIIPELSTKVYDLIIRYNGSITAEHNDGLIRTPYIEKMYGKEVYQLFEKVKEIFDPQNIFNPGKKVGADLDYAMKHIKHD